MNVTDQILDDAAEVLTEDGGTRGREAATDTRRGLEAVLVDATTVLGVLVAHRGVGETTAQEVLAREAIPDAARVHRGRTAAHRTQVEAAVIQDVDRDLWRGNATTE